jgi:hypothetical protein
MDESNIATGILVMYVDAGDAEFPVLVAGILVVLLSKLLYPPVPPTLLPVTPKHCMAVVPEADKLTVMTVPERADVALAVHTSRAQLAPFAILFLAAEPKINPEAVTLLTVTVPPLIPTTTYITSLVLVVVKVIVPVVAAVIVPLAVPSIVSCRTIL